jgi:hypothetical protein
VLGSGFFFFGRGMPTPLYRILHRRLRRTVIRIAGAHAEVSMEALHSGVEEVLFLCLVQVV